MIRYIIKGILVLITFAIGLSGAWWIWCEPIGDLASSVVQGDPCTIVGRVVERAPQAFAVADLSGTTWVLTNDPISPGSFVVVHGIVAGNAIVTESWRLAAGY